MITVGNTPKFSFSALHFSDFMDIYWTWPLSTGYYICWQFEDSGSPRQDSITCNHWWLLHCTCLKGNEYTYYNRKRQKSHVQCAFGFLRLLSRRLSGKYFVTSLNMTNFDVSDWCWGKCFVDFNGYPYFAVKNNASIFNVLFKEF
jgi:hypothetical protein